MIINIPKTGSHPTGLYRYLLEQERSADPQMLETNMIGQNARELGREFCDQWEQRPDIKNPVWHGIVSWQPGEEVSDENMVNASHDVMEAVGIDRDNHQFSIIRHDDTDHPHAHIVVNRVGFDGEVFLNRQSGKKAMEEREAIEERYGFDQIETNDQEEKPRLSIGETKMKERGVALNKDIVHQEIKAAIAASDGTFSSMDSILRENNVVMPDWNFSKTTDRFFGGSFHIVDPASPESWESKEGKPHSFTGSQVGWKAKQIQDALTARLMELSGNNPDRIDVDQPTPQVIANESVNAGKAPPERAQKLPKRLIQYTKKGRVRMPNTYQASYSRAFTTMDMMLKRRAQKAARDYQRIQRAIGQRRGQGPSR